MQRGNGRGDIFRSAGDYELFLVALATAAKRFQLSIHAYVLMTNHFHLLATPAGASSIAHTMQTVGRRYVPYFNQQYGRSGGLFEGRYRSTIVGDERYLMTCMRYIDLNPVRARIVDRPESYRWSSYNAHAMGTTDVLVTTHDVYDRLASTATDLRGCWRTFCAQGVTDAELQHLRADLERGVPWTLVASAPSAEADAVQP